MIKIAVYHLNPMDLNPILRILSYWARGIISHAFDKHLNCLPGFCPSTVFLGLNPSQLLIGIMVYQIHPHNFYRLGLGFEGIAPMKGVHLLGDPCRLSGCHSYLLRLRLLGWSDSLWC